MDYPQKMLFNQDRLWISIQFAFRPGEGLEITINCKKNNYLFLGGLKHFHYVYRNIKIKKTNTQQGLQKYIWF